MPAAQREGLELVYDIQGDGPDLLLIAGTAADRTMWTQVRPKLSEYFRTIAFDNRDSGESTICNDSYVMLDLAKDAVAVLDAAGAERAHVMGHSLGGMITQELALLAPERIASLTLANTTSRLDGYGNAVISMALGWAQVIEDPALLLKSLYFLALGTDTLRTTSLDRIVEGLLSSGPGQPREALVRQWQLDLTVNIFDRLPLIDAPTHVIWGAQDKILPEDLQRDLVNNIRGAQFTRIEHAGHSPMIETPDEFLRAATDFLLPV
jgi:pimeloyl-ACP methyl ester carboxylesterase